MRRAAVLLLLVACTSAPTALPTVTPTPSPSVPATPSPSLVVQDAVFSAKRAVATIETLVDLGPREASSTGYDRAAKLVRARFEELGYSVREQRFPVRAGYIQEKTRRAPVRAGFSRNVIAEPPGFNRRKRFIVVGGHLDTVPGSPGANDNASGVAVVLELARMARIEAPRVQTVFIAFGAEERRRQSPTESQYAAGSFAFVRSLSEHAPLRAAIILDMVGAGKRVELLGSRSMRELGLRRARALRIPARIRTTFFYSDHVPFIARDVPSLWLWAGDHDTLHSGFDLPSIIQAAELDRVGRLAWSVMRTFR